MTEEISQVAKALRAKYSYQFRKCRFGVRITAGWLRRFVWQPILKVLSAGRQVLRLVIHASYRRTSSSEFLRQQLGFGKDVCLGVTNPHMARWTSLQDRMAGHQWMESFRALDNQAYESPGPPSAELILCCGAGCVHELDQ